MVVLPVGLVLEPVVIVTGHIDFASEYGLDGRMLPGHVEEVLDAVHVAVIGDCEPGHAEFFCAEEELVYVAHPVENRILSVDVKMYEGHRKAKIQKITRPSRGRVKL